VRIETMVNRFNMKLKGKKLALPYPEDSSSLASKDAEVYQGEFSAARLAFEALIKGRRSKLLEPYTNRRAYYPIPAGEKAIGGYKHTSNKSYGRTLSTHLILADYFLASNHLTRLVSPIHSLLGENELSCSKSRYKLI
jgi:hypothetical protein